MTLKLSVAKGKLVFNHYEGWDEQQYFKNYFHF
jgi:hypothetical protein